MMPIADKDIVKLAETFWRVGWHYPLNVGVNTLWLKKKIHFYNRNVFCRNIYRIMPRRLQSKAFTEKRLEISTIVLINRGMNKK